MKVKIGLRGKNAEGKMEMANQIAGNLAEAEHLTNRLTYAEALRETAAELKNAIKNAEYGDRRLIAKKRSVEKKLDETIRKTAIYIDHVTDGNESEIRALGFETRKRNNRPVKLKAPEDIRTAYTEQSGILHVKWKSVQNAKSYIAELRVQDKGKPKQWESAQFSTKGKCTLRGLKPGKKYELRLRAMGAAGLSQPSRIHCFIAI